MKVLYREHRPKKFSEVIGQEKVVSLLKKSIEKNTISHSYIFYGSRGTGKTSVARIFSKEIGCDDIDIFEIDAASNTSVENIKELNKEIYNLPISSKYKVYILDEIHMLSKSAFNAFLKTLEEPPQHIVFILATTELNKVPDTIISRCVNLSFVKPSIEDTKKILEKVSKKEGYVIDKKGINLIAMMSEGSYRDALSILQKVFVISDDYNIKLTDVEKTLGSPDGELVNTYIKALLGLKEIDAGIDVLAKAVEMGVDINIFNKLCIQKVRAALLFKNKYEEGLLDFYESDRDFIVEISKNEKLNIKTLEKLLESSSLINNSHIKQLPLESVLLGL